MITYANWLLSPMSQKANNLDVYVTGIQAGYTNTTEDEKN